jgi:outer membrane protein OmpA-like peptidoglycan-associated protein
VTTATLMAWTVVGALAADVDPSHTSGSLARGSGTPAGESPTTGPEGPAVALYTGFVDDPMRAAEASPVSSFVPINLVVGWSREWFRVDLSLPGYGWVTADSFTGPALGDFGFAVLFPLAEFGHGVGIALQPSTTLPTGAADASMRGGSAAGLLAAVGSDAGALGWLVNLGAEFSQPDMVAGVRTGSGLAGTAGGWWHVSEGVRLGAEATTRLALIAGEGRPNRALGTNVFAQTMLPAGFALTAGAGTGIGLAGAPRYRLQAALSYGARDRDVDGDGLFDAVDGCVTEPEDRDGFADEDGCPDPDNDGDRISDLADACPDASEDLDGWSDGDGCPDYDNDADGIADLADVCPDVAGRPELDGCPDRDGDGVLDGEDDCPGMYGTIEAKGCPDRDGDGVPDSRDACPDDPRPPEESAEASDGCPKQAFVTDEGITITQRVDFETGSATLLETSHGILDQVASILVQQPQLTRVEVAGHTDNVASEELNQELSQERAEAVVAYLVTLGVTPDRLRPKGYGETKPMDTNRTEAGRTRNRRVEFSILEASGRSAEPPPQARATPYAAAGADPIGPPGLLSVKIAGGHWGDVELDGERLTKGAPFTDLSVTAGVHRVRVQNSKAGILFETEITLPNGGNVRVVVPAP